MSRRYYNGAWSFENCSSCKPLRAFRMFQEGMLSTDFWRVTMPSGDTHDSINQQYNNGMLTVKRTVYAKQEDYDNPANWRS